MKAAPIEKTIKLGVLRIDIRKYADGRYGFDYATEKLRRVKIRLHDLDTAVAKANEMIADARAGKIIRSEIDDDLFRQFLQWKAKRKPRIKIPELVKELIASREAKGRSYARLRELRSVLDSFAEAFPKYLDELTRQEVEKWLNARNVGPRRWNNMREMIITLHKFARRGNFLEAELTPVEQIETRKTSVTVGTYSPEQLVALLRVVPADWRPLVVLGAFCGVRPEEIRPILQSKKPGLRWENILWDKRKVDVPKEVSKVRRRRFIPLCDAAFEFLKEYRGEPGEIAPRADVYKFTAQWAKAAGISKWVSDGLRHSYASYRLALIKDIQQLALEMGNSPRMIYTHYLDLKHEDEAQKWFGIRPSTVWKDLPAAEANA